MAVIIPYADPNAHGTIGDSVSFRRRFNKVIFQKKPNPVQPNTAAQLAQRAAFKTVQNDWYSYPALSKEYYYQRAPLLGWTAKNLYTHAKLLSIMPNQTNIKVKEVLQCQLITEIGTVPGDNQLGFHSWIPTIPAYQNMGYIDDTGNVLLGTSVASAEPTIFKMIWAMGTALPLWYGVWMQYKDWSDVTHEFTIRSLGDASGLHTSYISEDGSAFREDSLINLWATGNF